MRGWGRPLGQLLRAAAWKTPHVEEERSGAETGSRGPGDTGRGPAVPAMADPLPTAGCPPPRASPRCPSPHSPSPHSPSSPRGPSPPQRLARQPPPPPAIASGSGGQGRPQSAPRRGQVRGRWPRGGQKMSAPRRRPRAPSGATAPRGRCGRVAALRGRERVPRGGVCDLK